MNSRRHSITSSARVRSRRYAAEDRQKQYVVLQVRGYDPLDRVARMSSQP
jgi:hypothetical protein